MPQNDKLNYLYKYRGLSNFRFFVDIILKNRLYAGKYNSLNDPMEGMYISKNKLGDSLKNEKDETLICSLSSDPFNTLLWSHYAEEHRGVAIELKVKEPNQAIKVLYDGICSIDKLECPTAKDILSHKHEVWEYENEYRVFSNKMYINIEIESIICGTRMDNATIGIVKALRDKINPKIKVSNIHLSEDGLLKRRYALSELIKPQYKEEDSHYDSIY